MQKFARNFAVIALLSLASAPVMKANTTGTNPKPKGNVVTVSALDTLQIVVGAYLGF